MHRLCWQTWLVNWINSIMSLCHSTDASFPFKLFTLAFALHLLCHVNSLWPFWDPQCICCPFDMYYLSSKFWFIVDFMSLWHCRVTNKFVLLHSNTLSFSFISVDSCTLWIKLSKRTRIKLVLLHVYCIINKSFYRVDN